jgi:DNA-binding NtrC family response regulator
MTAIADEVVLIIENDLIVALEIEQVLRTGGFCHFHIGGNCTYALSWLADHSPIVCIIDAHSSDGGSCEVFAVLRRRRVPFVAYSADYQSASKIHGARGGQWLLKPAHPELLLRAVDIAVACREILTLAGKELCGEWGYGNTRRV